MKLTKKAIKLIEDSVKHHERMQVWALSQPARSRQDYCGRDKMEHEIGENWTSSYCALCRGYLDWEASQLSKPREEVCRKCPLAQVYGPCGGENVENVWEQLNRNVEKTWRRFAKIETKMIRQLRSLLSQK
jgi:hypothetical protein